MNKAKSKPRNPVGGPLATLDFVGTHVAVAEKGEQVTLALAVVGLISRWALGDIQIIDLAIVDVVDKA